MDEVLVKIKHMRKLKYCSRGARDFANRHNLDWCRFINEGLPVEDLMKTGDTMALKLCQIAISEVKESEHG